jgi:hypothetical protein
MSSINWQKVLALVGMGIVWGALSGVIVGAVLDAIFPGHHLVDIFAIVGAVLLTAYWLSAAGRGTSGFRDE